MSGNSAFPHEEFDPDFDNLDTIPEIGEGSQEIQLPEPEETQVEIVDDTPDRDKNAKPLDRDVDEPSDEELSTYSTKVQKRIKDLTHARHDERRKREALERQHQEAVDFARRVHEENQRLRQTVETGTAEYVKMSTAQAEAKVEAARKKLMEANEAFDSEAVTAAQEELMEAKLALREAKNLRPPTVQPAADDVQTPQQQQGTVFDEKTQQWMSRNKWFRSPSHIAATSFALGLHNELVSQGYQPSTDAYFEQIDARMKKHFPDLTGETEKPPEPPARKPGTVVAPAARTQSTSKRVTLTASQVQLCRTLGITPQQYAAQLSKGAQ